MRAFTRALAAAKRSLRRCRADVVRHVVSMLYPDIRWAGAGSWGRACRVDLTGAAALRIGAGVDFADGARLFVRDGLLEIGARSFIGFGAIIVARERISIGQDVLIAEYVTIRDQDHVPGGFATASIDIEDGVWLGAKATVTRGVRIGARSVIGANAVVTRDIPPDVVAGGVPARILGARS